MSQGPERSQREGLTLMDLIKMFPTNEAAQDWFEQNIWGNKPKCPRCGNTNITKTKNQSMPYYCAGVGVGACNKRFSVKVGTVMEHSKISYQHWAIATYQFMTNVKSISSMNLHRDLGIRQATAWFMVQRLREAWQTLAGVDGMEGPVEVDEAYIGGTEPNKHADKKGKSKKATVVGIRDRDTGKVAASPVPDATRKTLNRFINAHVKSRNTKVYTDSNPIYNRLRNHESVNHSMGEYVRGQVHTNGIESFWALLERGYKGIFHHISFKHLHRYVNEFAGRLNIRDMDTIDMMTTLVQHMVGKRLTYDQLIS